MEGKKDQIREYSEGLVHRPVREWTHHQWLSFLSGWQNQRLGSPMPADEDNREFFTAGRKTAEFALGLAEEKAQEPS